MNYLFFTLFIFLSNFTNIISQNKVFLSLNLNEGDKFVTNFKHISSSYQEVNNEEQLVKKEISYKLLFTVLPSLTDTTFYIKNTYKRIIHVYNIHGNITVLNSDSIDKKNISVQDSLLLNVNKSFNFEIKKTGEIISIDSIEIRSFDKNNNASNQLIDNNLLNYIFTRLPDKQMREHDTWVCSDTLKGKIINIFNKKKVFSENLENTYVINEFSDIDSDKRKSHEVNSYYIFYKFKGKSKGIISLFKKSCMVKNANYSEISYGTGEIRYSKNGGAIYSWPMKIENSIYIKTTKIY